MQQVEKLKKEILKMSLEAEQDQLSALDSEVFVANSCLSCEEGEKSRQSLMMFCATNGPWWLLRAIMEKERAEKAEALARELKKSLKFFFDCISNGDLVEPEPSQWMNLELSPIAALYHKAKEVLGK